MLIHDGLCRNRQCVNVAPNPCHLTRLTRVRSIRSSLSTSVDVLIGCVSTTIVGACKYQDILIFSISTADGRVYQLIV